MGAFSGIHWLVILVIVILLFGTSKIPDLAKSIGKAMKEFKKATRDDDEDEKPGAGGKSGGNDPKKIE